MFKAKRENLLTIAGIVWAIAGINVASMGVNALMQFSGLSLVATLAGAVLIFGAFGTMFHKLMAKHAHRIRGYQDARVNAFRFFDARGYAIMAFMMILGFTLRGFHLAPDWFIAFFYTGLGTALALTGIAFLAARFCSAERLSALHGHHRTTA